MSKQNVGVGLEINKEAAKLALLACAITAGYTAAKFDLANPLIAGMIGGVVGYAISYVSNAYAALVLLVTVAVFVFTYSRP